mgnify:CR=1 FL=1
MTMKTNMLLVCAVAMVGCDDPKALPVAKLQSESEDSFRLAREQRLLADSKRGEEAKKRDDAVALLRADLSAPWTSLVVASRYDCSCAGTSYTGFKIVRENDTFTVAPWAESGGPERVGEPRVLSHPGVEQLLSEISLHYLAATLCVDPLEKVGRPPQNRAKLAEWRKGYLAAGGPVEGGDHISIEIRVATLDGLKKHSDMFDRHVPADFWRWILAFGKLKEIP